MEDLSKTMASNIQNVQVTTPYALMSTVNRSISTGSNTLLKATNNYLTEQANEKLVQEKQNQDYNNNLEKEKVITDKLNSVKLANNLQSELTTLKESINKIPTNDPDYQNKVNALKQQIRDVYKEGINTATKYGLANQAADYLKKSEVILNTYDKEITDKAANNLATAQWEKVNNSIPNSDVSSFEKKQQELYKYADTINDPKLKVAYLKQVSDIMKVDAPTNDQIIKHKNDLSDKHDKELLSKFYNNVNTALESSKDKLYSMEEYKKVTGSADPKEYTYYEKQFNLRNTMGQQEQQKVFAKDVTKALEKKNKTINVYPKAPASVKYVFGKHLNDYKTINADTYDYNKLKEDLKNKKDNLDKVFKDIKSNDILVTPDGKKLDLNNYSIYPGEDGIENVNNIIKVANQMKAMGIIPSNVNIDPGKKTFTDSSNNTTETAYENIGQIVKVVKKYGKNYLLNKQNYTKFYNRAFKDINANLNKDHSNKHTVATDIKAWGDKWGTLQHKYKSKNLTAIVRKDFTKNIGYDLMNGNITLIKAKKLADKISDPNIKSITNKYIEEYKPILELRDFLKKTPASRIDRNGNVVIQRSKLQLDQKVRLFDRLAKVTLGFNFDNRLKNKFHITDENKIKNAKAWVITRALNSMEKTSSKNKGVSMYYINVLNPQNYPNLLRQISIFAHRYKNNNSNNNNN
jgi:hypothetical protein